MASVEEGAAAAPANNASIWGQEGQGKFTIGLGLYFGLKDDSSSDSRTIITGQSDPSAEGCFKDTEDRVMENLLSVRGGMTTEVSTNGDSRKIV